MVVFGSMYSFNNLQALQQAFQHHLHIDQFQFNLLYTIVALPSIFLAFLIGFFIDYFGVRTCIVIISISTVLFQLIVAIGGFLNNYYIILIGRGLFGISFSSVITAQAYMISIWFKKRRLALALGIGITFPQLANALNSVLSPWVYNLTGSLGPPLLVSVFICLISAICASIAVFIDIKAQKKDKQSISNLLQKQKLQKQISLLDKNSLYFQRNQEVYKNSTNNKNFDYKIEVKQDKQDDNSQNPQSQGIKCKDIKKLKRSFWLIVVICMFGITLYIPFMDNVNSLYVNRFCLTQIQAGQLITITYTVGAFITVPLGIIIDKIGYRRYFIMTGITIFTLGQGIILLWPTCVNNSTQIGPIIALFLIGIGYCFYANCIVTAIPLVVSPKLLGTAFGIMGMTQAFAETIVPLISGAIISEQQEIIQGYKLSSLFFTIIGGVGVLITFGLFFIDQKIKRKLDGTSEKKKQLDKISSLYIQIGENKNNHLIFYTNQQKKHLSQSTYEDQYSQDARVSMEKQFLEYFDQSLKAQKALIQNLL